MASRYRQHRQSHNKSYEREHEVEMEEAAALELYYAIFQSSGKMKLEEALSRLNSQNKALIIKNTPEKFLLSFRDIFKFTRARSERSDDKVETIMPLRFCLEASEKNGCPAGQTCGKLHLCPYFVKGNCKYKEKCWMSHDIKDPHTMSLLREIRLTNINETLWLEILNKVLADTQLERGASIHDIPEICKFYNNQGGCSREKCAFLHVCKHFIDGTCKFGDGCKREHDLLKDKHNRDVLRHFGLRDLKPQQLLIILQGRERKEKRSASSSVASEDRSNAKESPDLIPQSSRVKRSIKRIDETSQTTLTPEKQRTDICGFFLRSQCNYGEKCMNLHKDLPYQWQLKDGNWKDLSEDMNIMLEREYCNADTNGKKFYHQGQAFVTDFDKMIAVAEESQTGPPLQMRRLSTESSAEAPPGHIFSTRWLWYWQDERNKWQCYDSPDVGFQPNTTSSKLLEKDFVQGQEGHSFKAGHACYDLSYKKMVQKNIKSQTERSVRRRPEFVAKEKMKEIEKKRKEDIKFSASLQASSPSCVSDIAALPPHWDAIEDKMGYILIHLSPTSQEYSNVEKAFLKTMAPSASVSKIERIQNPDLWTAFIQKKGRMAKKANDSPPKEMPQLFHGTSTDIVSAICQQGFDWRMCGKHGTLYGKGSYFATDASYSHRYAKDIGGVERQMFVAKVLVGSYVLGNSSMSRPPPKDPSKPHGDLHDSCVDDTQTPSIYVVFDNNQCYPEYLITYKK